MYCEYFFLPIDGKGGGVCLFSFGELFRLIFFFFFSLGKIMRRLSSIGEKRKGEETKDARKGKKKRIEKFGARGVKQHYAIMANVVTPFRWRFAAAAQRHCYMHEMVQVEWDRPE